MLKIGLISYNTTHLKSEQVFHNIIDKGYDLKIFLLPFIIRKKRSILISHRPNQNAAVNLSELGGKYKIPVKVCDNDYDINNDCDYYIILGANLLSEKCVKNKKIINCHPGIIPSARGLDSFKFSIINQIRLGVSLHFIDEKIDEGVLISTVETPVYSSDSLETLSRRHYDNEIQVISNFEKYLNSPVFIKGSFEKRPSTMRMSYELENEMVRKFKNYIQLYS